jgi:hypothetical protein
VKAVTPPEKHLFFFAKNKNGYFNPERPLLPFEFRKQFPNPESRSSIFHSRTDIK